MIGSTLAQWFSVQNAGRLQGAELQSYKDARLRRLVQQAYQKVPFYRELFDRVGFEPGAFRGLVDLPKLPIVSRTDLARHPLRSLISADYTPQNLLQARTSGTSGEPITVCASRTAREREALVWIRSWSRNGLKPTHRQATVRDLADYPGYDHVRWFQRLGLFRIQYLDMFAPPEALVSRLAQAQPDVLRGPPSILKTIGQHASGAGIRPCMLFSTSEALTDATRSLIESAFHAPVHDLYGATEAGCIAWQEPGPGHYRVNSDAVVLEIVNGNQPAAEGELGEVLITNLFAEAMPFIRYRLGDTCQVGSRSDPPNGVDVASIARIRGRTLEPMALADGSLVSPYIFMPDTVTGIREFRVVQESASLVKILVVRGNDFSEREMEADRRWVQDYVGERCRIQVEFVDSIPTPLQATAGRV